MPFFGPGCAYRHSVNWAMKNSAANKTALGATAVLSLLLIVALLSYHRHSELAAAMAVLSSGLVAFVIQREMVARQREMGRAV